MLINRGYSKYLLILNVMNSKKFLLSFQNSKITRTERYLPKRFARNSSIFHQLKQLKNNLKFNSLKQFPHPTWFFKNGSVRLKCKIASKWRFRVLHSCYSALNIQSSLLREKNEPNKTSRSSTIAWPNKNSAVHASSCSEISIKFT